MALKFGLLWPFRNPEFSRQPWPAFYRAHLDLCVESEALGYDHIWLSEHHFVEDGYSPSVLPIAAALAARTSRSRITHFCCVTPSAGMAVADIRAHMRLFAAQVMSRFVA